ARGRPVSSSATRGLFAPGTAFLAEGVPQNQWVAFVAIAVPEVTRTRAGSPDPLAGVDTNPLVASMLARGLLLLVRNAGARSWSCRDVRARTRFPGSPPVENSTRKSAAREGLMTSTQEHYLRVVTALRAHAGVSVTATRKKGFGLTALCVHNKVI